MKALTGENLVQLLQNALKSPKGFGGQNVRISEDQLRAIAAFANGDARTALNTLEMAVLNGEITGDGVLVTQEGMEQCISRKSLLYDKTGEEHYNLISALHKSMRNSDPDAAIYWMCRMLEGGENPLYIARRLIRFASEDVGMADSQALQVAVAAYQACHFLGMRGMRRTSDPCGGLPCHGAQVKRPLHGLRGLQAGCAHRAGRACAPASSQCAHPAYEGTGSTGRGTSTPTTRKRS